MPDYSVEKSLQEEEFWPEMERQIRRKWAQDQDSIRNFTKDRCINRLCHFTLAANLKSVFTHGLKSRVDLNNNNINHHRIETASKIYFQDFIYLSISSPNLKMIHSKFKSSFPLAIVNLPIKLLWKYPFFSIPWNSARRDMIPSIKQDFTKFLGIDGLKNLFLNPRIRSKHRVHISEPTDLQSEIIFLNPIKPSFLKEKEVLITPMSKISKEYLSLAKDLELFESGVIHKRQFKWLEIEKIEGWGPGNSPESRLKYNERDWRDDWYLDGN